MANKGLVLSIDHMDPVSGDNNKSVLYVNVAFRNDSGGSTTAMIACTVDWTQTLTQISTAITDTIRSEASGMGYTLGNNQLLMIQYFKA